MKQRVALCQTDLFCGSVAKNLHKFEQLLSCISADLVLLPELFTTGFSFGVSGGEVSDEADIVVWMQQQACNRHLALCGSAVVRTEGGVANRLLFVTPEGAVHRYDKRHLFAIGGEDNRFVRGEQRVVVDYKGVRYLLLICYDLRFPVWSRCRNDYDAILCVASWPASRREVWRTLLRARAIENQAYVIGVNRVGDDPTIHYEGDSALIDYKGTALCESAAEECVLQGEVDTEALKAFRAKFPAWRDADTFTLR
jgi:predicted amidohydrolase